MTDYKKLVLDGYKQLCDKAFKDPMVQEYAGAPRTCLYCGANEKRNGTVKHDTDCLYLEYEIISFIDET